MAALCCLLERDESESFHEKALPPSSILVLTGLCDSPKKAGPCSFSGPLTFLLVLIHLCSLSQSKNKPLLNHLKRQEQDLTATNWSKIIFSQTTQTTAAPYLHACSYLSHIVSGRSRRRCCETQSSPCLLMQTILM